MTYREKYMQEHPRLIASNPAKYACPYLLGYEEVSDCNKVEGKCEACWDREMTEGDEVG